MMMMMMEVRQDDVRQSLMTSRRIGCERLCFEPTLLLVERKGMLGDAGFILTDNAATCV